MKFWDSSALAPLMVAESTSARLRELASADADLLVWWGTLVECASAIARRRRTDELDDAEMTMAFDRLRHIALGWQEIGPEPLLRQTAIRFVRVHHLRAADALQLAAAFSVSKGHTSGFEFVCLDDRLAAAARAEGFTVL